MRRKIRLLVLIAIIVGLCSGLAISRGWDRKKIGTFELTGKTPGSPYTWSCTFTVNMSQRRDNPKKKAVKLYICLNKKGWLEPEETRLENSMSLEDWEEWVAQIKRVDEKLHRYWEKEIIED